MLPKNQWINHTNIYLLGLLILVIGLPLSKFMVSMSQFILLGNWLLELDYKNKFSKFWNNKLAVAWVGFFFLHLLSMLWTSNYDYGWHDIKIKLPILILPFVIASAPGITRQHIKLTLLTFVMATLVATVWCFYVYRIQVEVGQFYDPRAISIFTSHIRFGLMIVFSIFILFYYAFLVAEKPDIKYQVIAAILIKWQLYFISILQSVTAAAILFFIILFCAAYFLLVAKQSRKAKLLVAITLFIGLLWGSFYFMNTISGFIYPKEYTVKSKTSLGNSYTHNFNILQIENGNRVWVNVCEPELKQHWNKDWRVRIKYDDIDENGQPIRSSLIRYLTSKGLTKDKKGIKRLRKKDYNAIQKGSTNYKYRYPTITKRIYEMSWALHNYFTGGNPSGNTMAQKLEYWKNGALIFKDNIWLGVGVGDVQDKYQEYYNKYNSMLADKWRLRAHNQYLTFGVTFGALGLMYFLFLIGYTIYKNSNSFKAMCLWLIVVFSMLTEDTFETQAGVTFSMVFISLLFIRLPELNDSI